MHIAKLKIKNLKKFHGEHCFEFNDDVNILVGDNESGKSTILEAIEMVLNNRLYNQSLGKILSTDLFNTKSVKEFLDGDKSSENLPEILVEAYFDNLEDFAAETKLRGNVNSDSVNSAGVSLKIAFDPELTASYEAFIRTNPSLITLPIEFYKIEWYDFAWKQVQYYDTNFRCICIDPTRIHPTYGRTQYIRNTLGVIGAENLNTLNLSFRQLKAHFSEKSEVKAINDQLDINDDVTEKDLTVVADIASTNAWERNLQLAINDVRFEHVGKGEQTQVLLMLALNNKLKDVPFVLIEEPENHLSHINLVKLINRIETKSKGKQLFITTHSSYVLNKLSMSKVSVLGDGYKRLNDIDKNTVKRLKRLPGYDTLRIVLSKKVLLVEGPSDEIILKNIYHTMNGVLPEEHGIDIIVVRGVGFKNYLNIATKIGNEIRVVKDNDGNYQKNIVDWSKDYNALENIQFYSPTDSELHSLEPALIEENSETEEILDSFAKVILSKTTYKKYIQVVSLDAKKDFLRKWFHNKGGRKVDSAIRVFESEKAIKYPRFLNEAISFET